MGLVLGSFWVRSQSSWVVGKLNIPARAERFVWRLSAKAWSYSIPGMLHGLVAGSVGLEDILVIEIFCCG